MQTTKKKKGDLLFEKGDDANHLYILKQGKVLLLEKTDKDVFPVNVIEAGEFLGGEVLFKKEIQDLSYSYSAVALENIEYVRVDINDIYKILNKLPDWMNKLLCTLDRRMYDSLDSLVEHKLIKKFALRNFEISDKSLSDIIASIR
jgi:CRP-like cAMP-binding protein